MKKECTKCGVPKDLEEYHRDKKSKDGKVWVCKECSAIGHREYYKSPEVRSRAIKRSREYRINNRDSVALKKKEYRQSKKGKESHRISSAKDRIASPEKHKARSAVSNAIRLGKLVRQPCQECEATKGVEAHHSDYSKPLDVNWLCVEHHNNKTKEHQNEKP